jgi:monoterpene epsilon-lactone hydrolase
MKVPIKPVQISPRSRFRVLLLRLFFKPFVARMTRGSRTKMAALQIRAAGRLAEHYSGLPVRYRVLGGALGPVLGELNARDKLAILYLHGGGFVFPASPALQLELLGRLCRDLDAVGFMPDYRLAPLHPFPAALDDCERAYRGLLDAGFAAERIAVIGESAGGNLVLGLLQRIRKSGLPMPACAVPISPATELGLVHAPPSRISNAKRDAFVTPYTTVRVTEWYAAGQDTSNPEISPLYADYAGFPPLYFILSEDEMLLDDGLLAAECARAAGVETELDVWPVLPHAFPIFESMFAEAPQARRDIVEFVRRYAKRKSTERSDQ